MRRNGGELSSLILESNLKHCNSGHTHRLMFCEVERGERTLMMLDGHQNMRQSEFHFPKKAILSYSHVHSLIPF